MRMLFAGLVLVFAVAACQQRRNTATPGGDVETGAQSTTDTTAPQPQMNPPAPTDTSTKPGGAPADTTKKP